MNLWSCRLSCDSMFLLCTIYTLNLVLSMAVHIHHCDDEFWCLFVVMHSSKIAIKHLKMPIFWGRVFLGITWLGGIMTPWGLLCQDPFESGNDLAISMCHGSIIFPRWFCLDLPGVSMPLGMAGPWATTSFFFAPFQQCFGFLREN